MSSRPPDSRVPLERPLDEERIAALLDGRLVGAERDAVLAQIAADPEWREVLADAASVLDEPTSSDSGGAGGPVAAPLAPTQSTDLSINSRRQRSWIQPFALAATLVLAAGLGYWQWATRSDSPSIATGVESIDVLALVDAQPNRVALGPELLDNRWPRVRAAREQLDLLPASVRMGVLSVDLLIAARQADSVVVAASRDELVEYLQAINGSAPVVNRVRSATDAEALLRALRGVRSAVDTNAFDIGALIEVERVGEGEARGSDWRDPILQQLTAQVRRDSASIGAPARDFLQRSRRDSSTARFAVDSLLSALARFDR